MDVSLLQAMNGDNDDARFMKAAGMALSEWRHLWHTAKGCAVRKRLRTASSLNPRWHRSVLSQRWASCDRSSAHTGLRAPAGSPSADWPDGRSSRSMLPAALMPSERPLLRPATVSDRSEADTQACRERTFNV